MYIVGCEGRLDKHAFALYADDVWRRVHMRSFASLNFWSPVSANEANKFRWTTAKECCMVPQDGFVEVKTPSVRGLMFVISVQLLVA